MKRDKKVILFLLHLPPPVHGSSVVGEQVKVSRLINDAFRGIFINLMLSRKVKESRKIKTAKVVRFLNICLQLLGVLLRRKPHLCYFALTTTGAGFYKDVLIITLLRLFRVRIIYHIHNKGVARASMYWLNRRLYAFVFWKSYVILLSSYLYKDIEQFVFPGNVFYCPNGINDQLPVTRLTSATYNRPFSILFLSNLIREKGVFVLVDACSRLKERGYCFSCVFVGGEGDVSVKELTGYFREKGVTEEVKYCGKRYGDLKEMTFRDADVLVLPSCYDCFPLVILEAMQHSLPVVTAFEGGMPDMVDDGQTGYLIPRYDDVETLTNRLEQMIQNPSRLAEMGYNARMKYERHFTLPIFEHRLLMILQEVVNR